LPPQEKEAALSELMTEPASSPPGDSESDQSLPAYLDHVIAGIEQAAGGHTLLAQRDIDWVVRKLRSQAACPACGGKGNILENPPSSPYEPGYETGSPKHHQDGQPGTVVYAEGPGHKAGTRAGFASYC